MEGNTMGEPSKEVILDKLQSIKAIIAKSVIDGVSKLSYLNVLDKAMLIIEKQNEETQDN
jgi:hypothetical protein|tara:strand:+ start:1619 stop:1798 length:180 start_codon:yes stop_codon:yes gene_type:complete